MAGYQQNNNNDLGSWLLIVAGLVIFWPVGLFLLFRKLMGTSGRNARPSRHPYDLQNGGVQPGTQGVPGGQMPQQQRRRTPQMGKVRLDRGKGMTIAGAVIAGVFGLSCLTILPEFLAWRQMGTLFGALLPCMGFTLAGLVTMYAGIQRSKKSKRFRKYLALIGKRRDIPVATLAQAMPVSVATACDDLQDMLDDGIIPTGYLDMGSGRLILSDEGIADTPEPEPEPEPDGEDTPQEEAADAILAEIQAVNDAIADPVMSEKIDRIGAITGKIFAYQQKNPGKDTQLRSFLSYYLPTTLRILKAYAQMEAQGIEGENIHAAKERIEGMMDKVVEGFEKQLDRLFENDAMDITTDVEVLERMLEKDGLSGNGLTLGG